MAKSLAEIDTREVLAGTMKARRSRSAPTSDDVEIYKLSENGVPFSDIAAQYGVQVKDVRSSITRVEKWIESGVVVDAVAIKAQQHIRLEGLRQFAMKAFVKTSGQVRTVRRKLNADGSIAEEIITEKEQAGDPRYLNTAMKALEAQRDLWPGVSAPKATALTNLAGTEDAKVTVERLGSMDLSQLEVLKQAADLIDATPIEAKVSLPAEGDVTEG